MRPVLFALVLISGLLMPSMVLAQEARSSTIVSSTSTEGLLTFDDADKVGDFRIVFGESTARWLVPFAVMNTSKKSIKFARFKIEAVEDGEVTAVDDNAWVYPVEIKPGEFGFGEADFDFGRPTDDAELRAESLPPAGEGEKRDDLDLEDLRDINIVSGSARGLRFTGELRNRNAEDVEKIEISMLCVEDSGILTEVDSKPLERRLLRAGATAEFEVTLPEECEEAFFLTAAAEVRT